MAAEAGGRGVGFEPLFAPCEGRCGVALYAGPYSRDGLGRLISGITPAWESEWGGSALVAGAASRRVAYIGSAVDVEAELGVGQRFGDLTATEVWVALFFRWTKFPWNRFVKTTVALSTGLNYASHIDDAESDRSGGTGGSKLLHFLAPEITFAHPKHPNVEFLFRFHHRSGGSGYWGDVSFFNGTGHGSDFITVGARMRF